MSLKNSPKEIAYFKIILPHSLLPYKSARGNNQAAVTRAKVNGVPRLKFSDSFQRNLSDNVLRSRVAHGDKSAKIHALVTENFQLIDCC